MAEQLPYSEDDVNKWLKNMLATSAAERVGQQDPTAVINKSTTAPSTTSTMMPPTSLSSAPMGAAQGQFNQDVLNKRKELASTLKQFARGEIKVDTNQMAEDAKGVGVSRSQLGDLYKQYRNEFQKEPKQSFNSKIDEYAQSRFGSGAGDRRSLESESGKALRIARKLQRQGFGNAAEKMALAGAEAKMFEPSVKTEEYRKQQEMLGRRTAENEQRALATSQQAIDLQRKWMDKMNKELDDPKTSVLNNPMFASYFNK